MLMNQAEYLETISAIKSEIKGAQYRAVLGANRELITLYWRIGQGINAHKMWGNKFVENLASDIKLEFPNVTGYSVRNLKYMAKFAETYPDVEFVQTVSAQISWSHTLSRKTPSLRVISYTSTGMTRSASHSTQYVDSRY